MTIKKLKDELEMQASVTTIWRCLKKQGFKFGHIKGDISVKEREDIQAWRAKYELTILIHFFKYLT